MNKQFIKLASLVCVTLLLIIVGEWLWAHLNELDLQKVSAVKAQSYQPDEMPSINLTEQPEESYADLVDRPLFITGRRAVNEPEVTKVTPINAAGGTNALFDWQLSGVYTQGKQLYALFSHAKVKLPKAKDNFRKLSVGGQLDGWQVAAIKLDKVILKQGVNDKELPLHKPRPKQMPNPNEAGAPVPENAEGAPPADAPPSDEIPQEQPMPEPESEPTEAPDGDFENSNAHF